MWLFHMYSHHQDEKFPAKLWVLPFISPLGIIHSVSQSVSPHELGTYSAPSTVLSAKNAEVHSLKGQSHSDLT